MATHALYRAVRRGDDAEVAALLCDTVLDSNCTIPIHTAAYKGREDLVSMLLAAGADITDDAVFIACTDHKLPVLVTLLRSHADIRINLLDDVTPLVQHMVDLKCPEVVALLREAGA